jgi:hypothetical protein
MTIKTDALYEQKSEGVTFAEAIQNARVSRDECIAMQALVADNRTVGEIAFMLERTEETVCRHAAGRCSHCGGDPTDAA